MAELIGEDKPLPLFRKDLEIFKGPDEPDGSPSFNLYDPVRAKFFKITWAESLIIQYLKPGMTLKQLADAITEKTTLRVTAEQIKFFFLDSFRHDLLAVVKPAEHHDRMAELQNQGFVKWLLFHYLYLRIPLVNPDRFLTRTASYVRFLGSSYAFYLYGFLGIMGLVLLFTRLPQFLGTFVYFFNFEGLITYAVAISCVKVVHEFSHAYTAKNYGVYVPSMGIALIVLWPVIYTDVTDGWKLEKRSQRFYISAAGIIAETIIAGICTIGWYLSPPGKAQSLFFVVASITWVSTLVINLNPFIRFDGYYILGDLWGVDNLQHRTFAVARWKLRRWLLGIDAESPEPNISTKRMWGFIIYAICTWIYRLFLYTAIALFIYFFFTKALGVFLFFLEIAIFIIWPLMSEVQALRQLRGKFRWNLRMAATFSVVGILLAWFILPLPHVESFPGVSVPEESQTVYVPYNAIVNKVYVERNDWVKEGDPLIKLVSPSLATQIAQEKLQGDIVEKQVQLLGIDDVNLQYLPQKQAELSTSRAKLRSLQKTKSELDIRAKRSGKVYLWDTLLKPGQFVSKDQTIGKLADFYNVQVIAFIPESDFNVVHEGQQVRFRIAETNDIFYGVIERVNPVRSSFLAHAPLASEYGGELAVTRQGKNLKLVDSYYEVAVRLDVEEGKVLRFGQTGSIEVDGPWRSKFMMLLKTALQIFWRESGV